MLPLADRLANPERYGDDVVGIHMIHPPFPASFDEPPLTSAEQAYLDAEEI